MIWFVRYLIVMPWMVVLSQFIDRDQEHTIQGFAQGTSYSVKFIGQAKNLEKSSIDSIMSRVDSSMSLYKPYSLINQFNSSEQGLKVDAHFSNVVRRAIAIYKDTDGKFDITVAPLVNAWGLGPSNLISSTDSSSIAKLLLSVGSNKLKLKGNFLKKKTPGLKIDLNGIAQGYTVDLIAGHLISKGIKNFMVELGGEIRALGKKLNGEPFQIGIEGPGEATGKTLVVKYILKLSSGAVTTSARYSPISQQKGIKSSHLINPKTGYPIQGDMISATVYAEDAITADGYDNALMAMEIDEAMEFVNSRDFLEAYFIYRTKDGSIADKYTGGFQKLIVTKN